MDWNSVLVFIFIFIPIAMGDKPDNQGKDFVVAFMQNRPNDADFELFITTFVDDIVNVTVSTPGIHGLGSFYRELQVSRGSTELVLVDVALRIDGTALSPTGLSVQATDEIIVYGVNRQLYTTDAFLSLPTDVLGKEYYAMTYFPTVTKSFPQYPQVLVVGAFNETQVQITLPESNDFSHVTFNGTVFSGGDTLSLTMDRCDALQLQAEGYFDLTGAAIRSDKPVAVFSGNIRAVVGTASSSDHLVEQLVSTERWGKHFVIVPIPHREIGDYFKVVGNTDTTGIDIKCIDDASVVISETIVLSKAGDYKQVEMNPKSYCNVLANNSVFVTQIVKSDSNDDHDPALILIPPVEQYAAEYMFTTPSRTDGSYENFFLFVVNDGDKDGLRVDGVPLPSTIDYVSIPDTSLVGGYVVVTDGFHRFSHVSPISMFGGFMYGRYPFETYGMSVGLRLANINQPCTVTVDGMEDGLDNDCDGRIDEELCTGIYTGIDDDGDGRIDEDCADALLVPGTDDWDEWSSWSECIKTRNRTCKSQGISDSYCPNLDSETVSCENTSFVSSGLTHEEIIEMINTLRVNKRNTSNYKRTLYSAPDDRESSAIIGHVWTGVLVFIFLFFLYLDLGKIYKHLRGYFI
ncbi:IgGFc-binding protein-like [Argopecten irradians]|uniref:IgGFc-binding protein-like n=1 Tax=Argopecten irradians TaxID=31199 RepID=UPI0037207D72